MNIVFSQEGREHCAFKFNGGGYYINYILVYMNFCDVRYLYFGNWIADEGFLKTPNSYAIEPIFDYDNKGIYSLDESNYRHHLIYRF